MVLESCDVFFSDSQARLPSSIVAFVADLAGKRCRRLWPPPDQQRASPRPQQPGRVRQRPCQGRRIRTPWLQRGTHETHRGMDPLPSQSQPRTHNHHAPGAQNQTHSRTPTRIITIRHQHHRRGRTLCQKRMGRTNQLTHNTPEITSH